MGSQLNLGVSRTTHAPQIRGLAMSGAQGGPRGKASQLQSDAPALPPAIRAVADAMAAVRSRFATADPPVIGVHMSGPMRPLPGAHKLRVWFLVADDEAVTRAQEVGRLAVLNQAVAEELARRGHPEAELRTVVCYLDVAERHDPAACRGSAQTGGDAIRASAG